MGNAAEWQYFAANGLLSILMENVEQTRKIGGSQNGNLKPIDTDFYCCNPLELKVSVRGFPSSPSDPSGLPR